MISMMFKLIGVTIQFVWIKCVVKVCKFLIKHWWVLPSLMAAALVALLIGILAM